MSRVQVLTAVSAAPWEAALVTALDRSPDVDVVRRCVDVADLIAAASSGQARAVLLSADLRRLDLEVVARLGHAGVGVVGVVPVGDDAAWRRLALLGIDRVLAADADAAAVAAAVVDAVRALEEASKPTSAAAPSSFSHPVSAVPGAGRTRWLADTAGTEAALRAFPPAGPLEARGQAGRLVAVWGPTGAPGRTFVAVNTAAEAAQGGTTTMLVDADTYGGAVAQALGLLDEAPGLAAATRAATAGQLDVTALTRHARQVHPGLLVLTGIARADRWPELRPAALDVVWTACRGLVPLTVVDCGFSLERDEELSYDTAAPRRNGATLSTLARADVVLAVGSADPIGLQRLVRGLSELDELLPGADIRVVVNRVRRAAIGARPQEQIAGAIRRYSGSRPIAFIPDDRPAVDDALLRAATLREVAPRSPARQAVAALTSELLGTTPSAGPWWRRGTRAQARLVVAAGGRSKSQSLSGS